MTKFDPAQTSAQPESELQPLATGPSIRRAFTVVTLDSAQEVGEYCARIASELVQTNPRAVLGLATGSTPLPAYEAMKRLHREAGINYSAVTTFNLDEYRGIEESDPHSFRVDICRNLIDGLNISTSPRTPGIWGNTHLPFCNAPDTTAFCAEFEQRIKACGGIDLQLLGIGRNGHIGFNEPGSNFRSRTRAVELSESTRDANAPAFGGDLNQVPKYAITQGISTILEAKKILLLATGGSKAEAVYNMLRRPINTDCPASALRMHGNCVIVLDRAAAELL